MSEPTAEAPAFPGQPETPPESVTTPETVPDVNVIQPQPAGEDTQPETTYGSEGVQGNEETVEQAAVAGEAGSGKSATSENEWSDLDENGVPLVTNLAGEKETIRAYRSRIKLKAGDFLSRVTEVYGDKFTGMNQWRVEKNEGKRKKASVAEVQACQTVLQAAEQAQPNLAPTASEPATETSAESQQTVAAGETAEEASPLQ